MTPVDQAGYSILIYSVSNPPEAEVDRAVIVGPVASDVPPDVLGARPDHLLRAKWCAWPECFVFTPHPARYVVRDFVPFVPDLDNTARAHAQPLTALNRSDYSVFDLDATALIEGQLGALRSMPISAPDRTALHLPVPFENGLSLAGYEVRGELVAPGQAFDLITYWQVTDHVAPPVTIFVHLLDAQGSIRGQHDGFGAAVTMLEPGDMVIQHHVITVAADAQPGVYQLQVGLYDPNTLDRFVARPPDAPPIDRVLLSTLNVDAP
jgi:hypothetical protein